LRRRVKRRVLATLREPWHSPNRALARLIRPRIYDPRGGTVPAILLEILLFHKISGVWLFTVDPDWHQSL